MSGAIDNPAQICLDVIDRSGISYSQSQVLSQPIPKGKRGQFELVAQGEDPQLDIRVLLMPRQTRREEQLHPRYGENTYTFNDLLRYEQGVYHVGDEHQAEITVITNQLAVNAAQRFLGRTPGKDAYDFVEGMGGKFGAHIWVPGLERMQALVADRRHWRQREEDLDISDDVLGRIVCPARVCRKIQVGAARLRGKFREAFEAGERPLEAQQFARAEEDFKDYMANIARYIVTRTQKAPSKVDLKQINDKARKESYSQGMPREPFGRLAIELGLVAPGPPRVRNFPITRLYKSIAGNAALMLLRAELLRPRNDTPEAAERRIVALEEIAEAYSQKI